MNALILYIEDNPDNMMLVQRVIESMGCTFMGASTGSDGLMKAEQFKPDVIILDINLPDVDGYEVARRMRSSKDPYLLYVPVIALTANALRGEAEKVLASGCDVYMSKPVNIRELHARIEAFLEISHGSL